MKRNAGLNMYKRTIAERFYEKVSVKPNGCHEWTACIMPNGYGQISQNGKPAYAHRVAYELKNGPIPNGLFILHRCDNRRCVNIDHLFLGTFDDNMEDMVSKQRQALGSRSHFAKLTEEQVLAIRSAIGTHKEIAESFGVTQSLVSQIRSGRIWKHV